LKWKRRIAGLPPARFRLSAEVLLALCFLLGVWLGQAALSRVPESTGTELREYLRGFVGAEREAARWASVTLAALWLYLRYPLLAFLCGFTALGAVLIPAVSVVFGFSVSFAVGCFAAAFGGDGVWLALALLGLRCAVTLPCFFLLAAPALEQAAKGGTASFGRGRRKWQGTACWLRLGAVILILLAGACVDGLLSPRLLEAVPARMIL